MDTGIASIVVACISALATIITVIVSNNRHSAEMDAKLDKALAVQETKLEELTREVREHNNFARRMPVVEEQIKVANNRIKDLEDREELRVKCELERGTT